MLLVLRPLSRWSAGRLLNKSRGAARARKRVGVPRLAASGFAAKKEDLSCRFPQKNSRTMVRLKFRQTADGRASKV